MASYVVALFGRSSRGVLADLSGAIADAGGNLDVCRSLTLLGYQGMMLDVSTTLTRDELQGRLQPLVKERGLTFAVADAETSPRHGGQYDISVVAQERVGLVAGISAAMARHGLDIQRIDSGIVGESAYVMQVRVETSGGEGQADVESALREELQGINADVTAMEPVPASLVASIAKIIDVRLQSSLFQLGGDVSEADILSYRTGYYAEVKGKHEDRLKVEVGFKLMRDKVAEASDGQPLTASASFELVYRLPPLENVGADELQAFADSSAVFTALPYWRQLVQSMLPSMGVHKLVIPAFPLPSIALTGAT